MPTVDFYLVDKASITECYRFICQLADKAYQQKHQIYIHSNSAAEAETLDRLLWIFRDDSFLPHNILQNTTPPDAPLQIGHGVTPEHHKDILINLTPEVPAFYGQFHRILEIVPNDETMREIARKKYRFYQKQTCPTTSHKLTSTP